jgi:hypothetical protein
VPFSTEWAEEVKIAPGVPFGESPLLGKTSLECVSDNVADTVAGAGLDGFVSRCMPTRQTVAITG